MAEEKPKSISEKMSELNKQVEWFYGDEFSLDQAAEKYEATMKAAKEVKSDLETLKNKIEVIDKEF